MQIKLRLRPERPLIIPYNYNYQLQSALYSMLGEVGESDFWHDNGFGDAAVFKGFCFSGLNGKYRVDTENRRLCYQDNVYLEVRSCSFDFIDSFQRAVERHPYIKLFDTRLDITDASLLNVHLMTGRVLFDAVTPVVAHSTAEDGHTRYFSPEEDEYYIRICSNAEKKYEAVAGSPVPAIALRPAGEFKRIVKNYKGFYICGYIGTFGLDTSLRMAEFLYNTGLGEKNAQGFGFVNIRE
ncbi:MAG: CRISPR-associated endoribonuclease Cas6 [Clostridia bacterium]|nr:CRISPR-associated endoribonuclease Cas6 [Clostridia bacterium]